MPHDRSQGRKISKFPTVTVIDDGAFFDLILNGTNFKISKADLITALGATGTIIASGDAGNSAVLDKQGTVNLIRGLVNGLGVKSSVTPEGGLQLDHNFISGTGGVPLFVDTTETQPKIRGLLAGSGIDITATDGLAAISLGAAVSSKTVTVTALGDFPMPISNVITLEPDTDYFVIADVNMGVNRFVMNDLSQLRAINPRLIELTYTGTDPMFTSEDNRFTVESIGLSAVNAPLVDITSSTAAGIATVFFDNCGVTAQSGGSVSCNLFNFSNVGAVFTLDGFVFTATTMQAVNFNSALLAQPLGTCIDLGTTIFDTVGVAELLCILDTGVIFLDGLASSGNINAAGNGNVNNVRIVTDATALNNIDPDDNLWDFDGNNTIRDTIRDGIVSMHGNATETVIAVSSTPVLVAGTFVVGRSSGFTPDTNGRVTYDLAKDVVVPVSASMATQMASGGSDTIQAYVAVNGTVIPESGMTTIVSASGLGNITLTWQVLLTENDFVEVFIENETDTTNILVTDIILRVQ